MIKKSIRNEVIIFLTIVVLAITLNPDVDAALTAKSIGLGDDYAVIGGSDALYSNPAAVDINDNSFVLDFNMSGEAWNNIFMNDNISDNDKDGMVDIANKNGLLAVANAIIGGKMAIGPVTIFLDGRGNSLSRLSPDLAELLIRGNELEGIYNFAGTEGTTAFYTDAGVNYSHKLSEDFLDSIRGESFKAKNMYFGITYHYLSGGFAKYTGDGGFEIGYDENDELFINGNDGKLIAYYSEIDDYSDTAKGHAFDLGVYSDVNDKYSWGFSILNIGASLTAEQIRKYEYTYEYDDVNDEWNVTEPVDGGVLEEKKVKVKLPLIVKLGGKMRYSENIDIFANYTVSNYSDSIYTESYIDHRISVAAEFTKIKFLPLRLGLSYSALGNDFNISTGMGLHLGVFKLDVGVADLTGLFHKSKGAAAGLNLSLVF